MVTDTFRQKVPTNEVSNGPHVPDHSGIERRQTGRQTVELITKRIKNNEIWMNLGKYEVQYRLPSMKVHQE